MRAALIGATGAVGTELLRLLEKRNFPLRTLRCFAAPRSLGKKLAFRSTSIPVELLTRDSFQDMDLAFFCAGSDLSQQWIPQALHAGTFAIDSSSAFRMQADVPLIIPEINAHLLQSRPPLAASPNCAATILLLPLFPLHRIYQAKRIVVSTYQAASGGGRKLMERLQEETRAYLENSCIPSPPCPYAFNLFLHPSRLQDSGYNEEESKIQDETRKILEAPNLQLSATCVRVPVLRAHSLSANVEFQRPISLEEAHRALAAMPGIRLFEEGGINRFATPRDAAEQEEVFYSRVRLDPSRPNTLEFWSVGDQLLKGAALNAIQIAEAWLHSERIPGR